jgi:hypothetical protein
MLPFVLLISGEKYIFIISAKIVIKNNGNKKMIDIFIDYRYHKSLSIIILVKEESYL